MKTIFAYILFVSPIFAFGSNPPVGVPTFDIPCKYKGTDFTLHFKSKSGDVAEDDMAVTLEQNRQEIQLPLKAGWYKSVGAIRDISKLPTVCKQAQSYEHAYPTFEVSPSKFLIFFDLDNRPTFESMSVILYDSTKKRVLDHKENIGSIKESNMTFRPIVNGVVQRLVHEWLKNTGCDCAESAIEDWMYIRVKNDKIQFGWN